MSWRANNFTTAILKRRRARRRQAATGAQKKAAVNAALMYGFRVTRNPLTLTLTRAHAHLCVLVLKSVARSGASAHRRTPPVDAEFFPIQPTRPLTFLYSRPGPWPTSS